ncbi:MAG: radical SAM family heme chaperone HemW [Alphaproteobacteria bacterium]
MTTDLSLYIHWPFCLSKCPYCDFNSTVPSKVDTETWQEAYLTEMRYWAEKITPRTLKTIYFGGGTPSLMSPVLVENILAAAAQHFTFADDIEITLEANPTSTEIDKLRAFKTAGINRLSLGVQSLRDDALQFLGRAHSADDARKAILETQQIFKRTSFDLIYARPDQTLTEWEAELREAIALADSHLSVYQLTIEEGTPFGKQEIPVPEGEKSAAFYDLTNRILDAHGFRAYEVSNYAKKGEESRHNFAYWHYDDYLGLGAGAQSRLTITGHKYAIENTAQPQKWLEAVQDKKTGLLTEEKLTQNDQCVEMLMMGLRLQDGISRTAFRQKTGQDLDEIIPSFKQEKLVEEGLLVCDEISLRATEKGRQCLNTMLAFLCDF